MASNLASVFRPFEGTRNPVPIALFRIAFFSALAIHFFPSLIQLDDSYVPRMIRSDEWSHWLYIRFWRVPRGWLRLGSIVTMVACVMGIVGFRPRIAAIVSGVGFYCFASFNGMHVQTLALITAWAILLLFALCGGGSAVWSVDALLRRGQPPIPESSLLSSLILFQILLAVFFSGLEKLIAGWPFSNEMKILLAYPRGFLLRDWAQGSWLRSETVTAMMSWFTVLVEVGTPVMLLFRRTRRWALLAYQLFFLGIVAMLEVPPLFYFMFAFGALFALDDDEVSAVIARLRRLRAPATAALGLALLCVVVGCKRRSSTTADASPPQPPPLEGLAAIVWDDTPLDWARPLPVTPAGGVTQLGYVGSDSCRQCHAAIVDSYARHSMAKTGLRALSTLDRKWLAKIFDAGKDTQVLHEKSGFAYRPVRRGNEYFIEETKDTPDGTRVHTWLYPITHALSAGGYGLTFYTRQGGRFFRIPVDYFAKIGRWGLDPVAFKSNPRFAQRLGLTCINCHADFPRHSAGAPDVFFDPLPTGIGCERCHGPGEKHAQTSLREDVVNPARLPQLRQLDVCAQCHLSSFPIERAGRGELDYRPGQPLDDVLVNHIAEPVDPARVILLAHPERLVRSECFKQSAGKLTCTTCHDPHKSSFEQTAAHWEAKCIGCHQDLDHPAVDGGAVSSGCVGCHMERRPTANMPQIEVTDHWIQRRPPASQPGHGEKPERLVPWSTFVGQPVTGIDLPAILAAAYASAGRVDEAERLAAKAMATKAQVPELYEWLIGYFRVNDQRDNVARAQTALLRIQPDARAVLIGWARTRLDRGGDDAVPEALIALDRLLAANPDDAGGLETKGMILFRTGRVAEAKPLFEKAVTSSRMAGVAEVALAAIALRDGRSKDALSHLEAARRIEPADSWILERLVGLYTAAKDARAAEVERARTAMTASGKPPGPTDATRWLPPDWR